MTLEGRWAIACSNNEILYMTAGQQIVFGRSEKLPVPQQFKHPYVSREHLTFHLDGPHRLQVECRGKNPVFYGSACRLQPTGTTIVFQVDEKATKATLDSTKMVTKVPPLLYTDISQLPRAPRSEDSIYFPDGLYLPDIHVAYESHGSTADVADKSAATSTLSVSQMLAVPTRQQRGESSDDEDTPPIPPLAPPKTVIPTTPPPRNVPAPAPPARMPAPVPIAAAPVPIPAAPVPIPPPPRTASSPPAPRSVSITTTPGEWVWKCHDKGKANDPRSWRPYPGAVQRLLEEAFLAGKTTVDIPDNLMKNSHSTAASYSVCFCEKSLKGEMIQYQNADHTRYRSVRRNGGPPADRKHVRMVSVIPVTSTDEDEDEDEESSLDSTEEDSASSDESFSSDDTYDSEESKDSPPRKKKR